MLRSNVWILAKFHFSGYWKYVALRSHIHCMNDHNGTYWKSARVLRKSNFNRTNVVNDVNDNDNDNELFIQTKSNEKHHKGNINNTYRIPTLQRSCQGDCT